jgi:tight adherence protein C
MITSLNPDLLTVLTVVVVITLILAALSRDRAEQRKRRVSERLSRYCLNLETEETISARWGLLQRLMGTVRVLASPVVASLFAREKERVLVRQLLWSAGFRSENAISILAAAKSTFAIAVGLCTYAFVVRQGLIGLGPVLDAIAVMGGAVVGGIIPEYALRWAAGRRREAMRESLPDAIDLLVIAAQAGLSLDMAIDRVTREMGAFAPELGAEFSITLAEMQALPDRTEALQNLGRADRRAGGAEFRTHADPDRALRHALCEIPQGPGHRPAAGAHDRAGGARCEIARTAQPAVDPVHHASRFRGGDRACDRFDHAGIWAIA